MNAFKVRLRLRQIRVIILLSVFKVIALFYKAKSWVICERGTEARDNGFAFYKYMKTNHPEKKVYYLITDDSSDYNKVKVDAVKYGSAKAYWVIVVSEKIISAHYASVIPTTVGAKIFHLFKLYKKFYFLQHGIIKDDLKVLYSHSAPMSVFICGAKPEYEYVKAKYGHPEGVVKYTGLARFDALHNIKKREQIVVMPTWRKNIRTEKEFLLSDYYCKWQEFLNDASLNRYLLRENIKLVFYRRCVKPE